MQIVTMEKVRQWAGFVAVMIDGLGHKQVLLGGIPRGGIPVAYAVANELKTTEGFVVSTDELGAGPPIIEAPLILLDDIVVSGETMARERRKHSITSGCYALVQKGDGDESVKAAYKTTTDWVQFPWETRDDDEGKPEDAVRRLIEYLGEDPSEARLLDTPARVLRFYDELRDWPSFEPTTFKTDLDDMVVVSNIPFASLCEHHMLPYYGEANVAYIPNKKLLGLSKIARFVAENAAGLSTQEELTRWVASNIEKATDSGDVAVTTTAVHTCMVMRGPRAIGSRTSSSAMLGKFREAPALRAEFLSIVEGARALG